MRLSQQTKALLVARATAARNRAYAPYSRYTVGAAVLMEDGRIFEGCNVENAVYPLGLCAERVAIFKAISEGSRKIAAIAVVTANGGSPCGACRQVIREFGEETTPILVARPDGTFREWQLAELLPDSFSAEDLTS